VDGKTVRGSESEERKAIHIVSAWVDEVGLVLGQTQTREKSNEITVIPALLEALDISGGIVTIDAMGCIRSMRTVKGTVTRERRYYLTTLTDVGEFARSARHHWGIENKLHWVMWRFGKIPHGTGKTTRRRTWRYCGRDR
jgi:predicted transposase YbfD/YdcC